MSTSQVRFRKVQGQSWNGNGFGIDPAWWDAEVDGEVIARWRPRAGMPRGEIYGKPTFGIHGYRQWRAAVLTEAGRRTERPQ